MRYVESFTAASSTTTESISMLIIDEVTKGGLDAIQRDMVFQPLDWSYGIIEDSNDPEKTTDGWLCRRDGGIFYTGRAMRAAILG